jgi:hypothetical protein
MSFDEKNELGKYIVGNVYDLIDSLNDMKQRDLEKLQKINGRITQEDVNAVNEKAKFVVSAISKMIENGIKEGDKEMSADELLADEGFEKIELIDGYSYFRGMNSLDFNEDRKAFSLNGFVLIDVGLYKAIGKKMEELGWFDER